MKTRVLAKAKPPEAEIETAPHQYLSVKNFKAVNTKADRTAIEQEEFAWLENLIPRGYANVQAVPNYRTLPFAWTNPVASWFTFTLTVGTTTGDCMVAFQTNGAMEI